MNKKYQVADSQGRIIVLEEKTSIILTIAFILVIIAVVGSFVAAVRALTINILATTPFILMGFIGLVYVFVLNHLRKKGDMSTDRAVFPTIQGNYVEVVKKSSIWITLAYALSIIGLIGSLGVLGYGIYVYASSGFGAGLVMTGVMTTIFTLVYLFVLRFLRTKIDIDSDIVLRTTSGQLIELYKRRSIWLTLGMVFAIMGAIIFLALGVLMFTGITVYYPQIGSMIQPALATYSSGLQHAQLMGGWMTTGISGLPAIISGLLMLVTAAVLSFLRERGHIREYKGQTIQSPVSANLPSPPST